MPPIPLPNPFSTQYFPPTTAGPQEIRQYVVTVLATEREVPVPEAEGIASKWIVDRKDVFREIVDWTNYGRAKSVFGERISESLAESMMDDWWHSSEGATIYYIQVLGAIASCILIWKAMRSGPGAHPKAWKRDFGIALVILTLVTHYCRLFDLNPHRTVNMVLFIPMSVVTACFWASSCHCADTNAADGSHHDPALDKLSGHSCGLSASGIIALIFVGIYYAYWLFSFAW